MNAYRKFACIYCGQHMECAPRLGGSQILCPACGHRIVIPIPRQDPAAREPAAGWDDWHTSIPMPLLETPTRYRSRMAPSAGLA